VDDAVAMPAASAAAALARVGEDEHMDSSCPPMRPVLAAAAACPRFLPPCNDPGSCRPATTPPPEAVPQPTECGNLPLEFSTTRISYK
jgi:hypothetical protein